MITWIDDMVAIGDTTDKDQHEQFRQMGFCVAVDTRQHYNKDYVPQNSILKAAMAVKELTDSGHKVLIYCRAGIDRSPFFGALYRVAKYGEDINEAYMKVAKSRPITFVHYDWITLFENEFK